MEKNQYEIYHENKKHTPNDDIKEGQKNGEDCPKMIV